MTGTSPTNQQQQQQPQEQQQPQRPRHRVAVTFNNLGELLPPAEPAVPPAEPAERPVGAFHPQLPPNEPAFVSLVLLPIRLLIGLVQFQVAVFREMWRQGKRDIRPIDGGILFQLFFVCLIVAKSSDDPERQQTMIMVVTIGFLWHIKALQFLWKFCITDNVPLRILKGLDPDGSDDPGNNAANANANAARNGAPVPPNRRDNANNNNAPENNANANANNRWAETFAFGGIAAPDNVDGQGGHQNPVARLLWDIVYLFGSFFFSVFPMWRPEQRPRPPAQVEEEAQPENVAAPQNGNRQQLPQIQPPRDAFEAADSESSDEASSESEEESDSNSED